MANSNLKEFLIIAHDETDEAETYIIDKYGIDAKSIRINVPYQLVETNILVRGLMRVSLIVDLATMISALVVIVTTDTVPKLPSSIKSEVVQLTTSLDESVNITGKIYSEEQVEHYMSDLTVELTGARDGDILFGSEKRSKDALIRIHGGIVKPRRKDLDQIRQYPNLWAKFINKLTIIPFFRDLSLKQRAAWLRANQTDADTYIGEPDEPLMIELLQPGNSLWSSEADSEDLDAAIKGNPNHEHGWWTEKELTSIIPGKPGSRARRHTLIFHKGGWRIAANIKQVATYSGIVLNIDGSVSSSASESVTRKLFVIDDVTLQVKKASGKRGSKTSIGTRRESDRWETSKTGSVAILVPKIELAFNLESMATVSTSFGYDVASIRHIFKNFTAGDYKSLLQKLIRFRASKTRLMDGTVVDTRLVLVSTMTQLALHPGSFVEDIGRYVTGLESFGKRLGVCICEDSAANSPTDLSSLFTGALLAQRNRTWRPDTETLARWIQIGLDAFESSNKYQYDIPAGLDMQPFVLNDAQSPIKNASALIDELKSFGGDLAMIRYIADKHDDILIKTNAPMQLEMPIYHCCDQHSMSGMVYFVNPELLKTIHESSNAPRSTPFAEFFTKLFKEVTGYNPRRTDSLYRPPGHKDDGFAAQSRRDSFSESDAFVTEVRKAQYSYILAKQTEQTKRATVDGSSYILKVELVQSWIAGMVGAIEVKGKPAVLVTMVADDPLRLIVIRRPSREIKDEPITVEREEEAIAYAKALLVKGVPMNKCVAPIKELNGMFAYLRVDEHGNEYYTVGRDGTETEWTHARKSVITLPYHASIDKTLNNALTLVGDGIEVDAWNELKDLYESVDDSVWRRVLYYLSGYANKFEMNRISRDGGGTKHSVKLTDVNAYQCLLQLSILFPAALRPVQYRPTEFTSPVGPLLWKIVSSIKTFMSKDIDETIWDEVVIKDERKRKLWEHQSSSIDEMIETHKQNIRGHFLCLSVGSGKTLICMSYLEYLLSVKHLPNYIVYTLPPEALVSVANEILAFGLPVRLVIPLKTKKKLELPDAVDVVYGDEFETGRVNLIVHDHLRLAQDALETIADQTLFIFDEVHLLLYETQRTGVALQLSRLSREFIALTGTPVIDNKIYRLVPWLSQIVLFAVNITNFWTSLSIMVSRKASTGIKTSHSVVWEPFTVSEEERYKQLCPVPLGGTNTNARINQLREAVQLSYEAATRGMVTRTLELLATSVKIGKSSKRKRGVLVIAMTAEHQQQLKKAFIDADIDENDIALIEKDKSFYFTDDKVKAKQIHPYKIVITTSRRATGYSVTYLSAFVSGMYPSNQATRTQLEGRINRIDQRAESLEYYYVGSGIKTSEDTAIGILPLMYERHRSANSLEAAIKSIAKNIK